MTISTPAVQRAGTQDATLDFHRADTWQLPFADQELDGVIAECSLSVVRDQAAALDEIRRVLKPDGKLAVTDVAVTGRLPEDIAQVIAPWTCLAELISRLKRQLLLLGTGSLLAADTVPTIDLGTTKHWLDRFQAEVDKGTIRYLRFNLQKVD
jgi:ubiquinone/menaquinone biosynthesis C-methylase UbiE